MQRYPWYTLTADDLAQLANTFIIRPSAMSSPIGNYSPPADLLSLSGEVFRQRYEIGPAGQPPGPVLEPGAWQAHQLPVPYPSSIPPKNHLSPAGPTPDRGMTPEWL